MRQMRSILKINVGDGEDGLRFSFMKVMDIRSLDWYQLLGGWEKIDQKRHQALRFES
jgi:hypothetical protein